MYAYAYESNTVNKYDTIQEDVADMYLDDSDLQESPLDDFNDEDDDALAQLFALTWEN